MLKKGRDKAVDESTKTTRRPKTVKDLALYNCPNCGDKARGQRKALMMCKHCGAEWTPTY